MCREAHLAGFNSLNLYLRCLARFCTRTVCKVLRLSDIIYCIICYMPFEDFFYRLYVCIYPFRETTLKHVYLWFKACVEPAKWIWVKCQYVLVWIVYQGSKWNLHVCLSIYRIVIRKVFHLNFACFSFFVVFFSFFFSEVLLILTRFGGIKFSFLRLNDNLNVFVLTWNISAKVRFKSSLPVCKYKCIPMIKHAISHKWKFGFYGNQRGNSL